MAVTGRRTAAGPMLTLAGRITGAGLVAAMAGIHLYLWTQGYRDMPTIGPLFLVNGIVGAILTLAVLAAPARPLPIVTGATALFTAGTLGALVLSLTVGLFGFADSLAAPLAVATIGVESAGVVVLAGLTALASRSPRSPRPTGRPTWRRTRRTT